MKKPIENEKQYKNAINTFNVLMIDPAVQKFLKEKNRLHEWNAKQPIAMDNGPVLSFEEKVINDRINETRNLLLVKGKEYVRGNDRLHNFRRAAEMERKTMPRVLHGMLQKHLVSYLDILDDIDNGNLPTEAKLNEKMGDIIVYFLLQEATIKKHTQEVLNNQH